jgi:hypothetical protein
MEYQQAMLELGAMQQVFLQIGHMRPNHTLSRATINAAAYIALSSVELIGGFLKKTEKYRERMGGCGSSNVGSGSWPKMGWVLFDKNELKELKDSLHWRLTNIAALFSTAEM